MSRSGRNQLTEREEKRILELKEEGMSMDDIAKRFDCSRKAVQRVIQQAKKEGPN